MKWIRWPGLIAFVVIVTVIVVAWIFLIDRIVHNRIEKYGTDIVGAKVDLDSVDVTLFPLGVELIRLQVTDPERPMRNAFEVGLIEFSLDTLNLLKRKIIIDEMSIVDVELGTHRKTSGAISEDKGSGGVEGRKKASPKASEKGLSFPSLDIPDVDEVLEKEKLETLILAETIEKEIQGKDEEYKNKLKELPGEDKFKEYEKRVKRLESTEGDIGGLVKGVKEADKLIDDIEDDLKLIKDAKRQFEKDYASLKNRVNELTKAPEKDIARLKEKYSLSSEGVGNMSYLLFGPKISAWVEKGIYWYGKVGSNLKKLRKGKGIEEEEIKPERGKGINIAFKEDSVLPDLLIRKIETSIKLDLGDLWGSLENVTPDQETLGVPLTFEFSGESLKNARLVTLDGSINHTNPEAALGKGKMRFYGYKIQKAVLSDQEELPITLEKCFLDADVNAVFKEGVFDIDTNAFFDSVELNISPKESSGKIVKTIIDSLSDISHFTLKANIKGTFNGYKTSISSDIDDVMKRAVKNLVRDQTRNFEKELRYAVNQKVKGPISDVNNNLRGLSSIDKDLSSREKDGNQLIKGIGTKKGSGKIKLPF